MAQKVPSQTQTFVLVVRKSFHVRSSQLRREVEELEVDLVERWCWGWTGGGCFGVRVVLRRERRRELGALNSFSRRGVLRAGGVLALSDEVGDGGEGGCTT